MLKITIDETNELTKFKLEGRLTGAWVAELERSWLACKNNFEGRRLTADLSEATFVDADGQKLLARMYRQGVRLRASGCLIRSIVEQIEHATASNETHPACA